MGSWFFVCIVLFSNEVLLRGSVPFENLVRWSTPARYVIGVALGTRAGGARWLPFHLGRSSLARWFVFWYVRIPGPCPLAFRNGCSNTRDRAVIDLVHIRGPLGRNTSCPGLVPNLIALAAQRLSNGHYARPVAGTWIGEPRRLAPSSGRGCDVAKVVFPNVFIF